MDIEIHVDTDNENLLVINAGGVTYLQNAKF
jgi:hypothetical protein